MDEADVFSYLPENVPIFREVGSDRAHYTEVTRQEDIWREGLLCHIIARHFPVRRTAALAMGRSHG